MTDPSYESNQIDTWLTLIIYIHLESDKGGLSQVVIYHRCGLSQFKRVPGFCRCWYSQMEMHKYIAKENINTGSF